MIFTPATGHGPQLRPSAGPVQTPLNRLHTGFMPRRDIGVPSLSRLAEVLLGSTTFPLSRDNPWCPTISATSKGLKLRAGHHPLDLTADRFLHNMVRRTLAPWSIWITAAWAPTFCKPSDEANPRQKLVTTLLPRVYLLTRYPNLLDESAPTDELLYF